MADKIYIPFKKEYRMGDWVRISDTVSRYQPHTFPEKDRKKFQQMAEDTGKIHAVYVDELKSICKFFIPESVTIAAQKSKAIGEKKPVTKATTTTTTTDNSAAAKAVRKMKEVVDNSV